MKAMGISTHFRTVASMLATAAAFLVCGSGCIVENHPADTRVEFEETTNIGQYCGGPFASWTIVNRETGDQGTAGCEQPVLFVNLTPGATYTFDVTGYAGNKVCWEGSCQVTAISGTTTNADCSHSIQSLCGY